MLHDDWEIFGDGSGSVLTSMIEPASQILKVCNNYNVPYTFFAEFGQQLAMLNSDHLPHKKEAALWEEFLKEAIRNGHDVQLHFHPQWIDANWEKDHWILNFEKWSIANLSYKEIKYWLGLGKNYLENLLKPLNPNYRTIAFRAGSWMAQPSKNLIKALSEIGIKADCTVIKGKRINMGKMGAIDYTNAPSSLLPWYASEWDIATSNSSHSDEGLLCIPTYAEITYLHPALFEFAYNYKSFFYGVKRNIHFYKKKRNYNADFNRLLQDNQGVENISHFDFLNKVIRPQTYYLDFGKYHFKTILKTLMSLIKLCEKHQLDNVPVILFTHSKSFYDLQNFENLLAALAETPKITFSGTQAVIENLNKKLILRIKEEQRGEE